MDLVRLITLIPYMIGKGLCYVDHGSSGAGLAERVFFFYLGALIYSATLLDSFPISVFTQSERPFSKGNAPVTNITSVT